MAQLSKTRGKKTKAKARMASPVKRRTTIAKKRRMAPAPRKNRSVSELTKELNEAHEQQAAAAEILRVINASPTNLTAVFSVILEKATRICEAAFGVLFLPGEGRLRPAASLGVPPTYAKFMRTRESFVPEVGTPLHRVMKTKAAVYTADDAKAKRPGPAATYGGARSLIAVPIMNEDRVAGAFVIYRTKVQPFTDRQVELLSSFAGHASLAIQNAGLFKETEEALERQTATAEILKVIASSPSDVQPVFEAIANSANRLIGGFSTAVFRFVEGMTHLAAFTPTHPAADETLKASFPRPIEGMLSILDGVRGGKSVQITDTETWSDVLVQKLGRARGFRSQMLTPLMSEGTPIGMISVTRKQPGAFADHHVQLFRTFADQAVIAIENVRLFEEVRAKTRDLQEALTSQTGSAKILKVIASSPTNVGPVLKAIVESACELCEADDAVLRLREGEDLCVSAHHGPIPTSRQRWTITPNWTAGRCVLDRKPIHVSDMLSPEGDEFHEGRKPGATRGLRTILSVPLLREGEPIGAITLRRTEVHPFSDKQMNLLQTFADQAVIAIENARLFNETKEALGRQTATADVLRVISSSSGDLQPVFKAMLSSALEICEAQFGNLLQFDGEGFTAAELHNAPAAYAALYKDGPLRPNPNTGLGRIISTREVVHIEDVRAGKAYVERDPLRIATVEILQARTFLAVPMLRNTELVGAIIIYRQEVRPFTEKQIGLVTNFANQAVIAIENARLLNELRERTDDLSESLQQQTTTADVLKVISRSAFDLDTVLKSLISTATRLCDTEHGQIFRREGDVYRYAASVMDLTPEYLAIEKDIEIRAGCGTLVGRVAQEKRTVQIVDALDDPDYAEKESARIGGVRTMLGVPMLRDGEPIGTFALARTEVRPFTQRQVELVTTFADQAVIAIENVRLFNETKEALEGQTATADILKVIASSLDDVGPIFEAIAERSNKLVNGLSTAVYHLIGDMLHLAAFTRRDEVADAALMNLFPCQLSDIEWYERTIRQARPVQVEDSEVQFAEQPALLDLSRKRGFRSAALIPLLHDSGSIGIISVTRAEPGKFREEHIRLLQTFADQAVIAISNVELFQAVQERTRELSQSLDDLRTAQDRLVQTEKLASLGQLTAGIAHEIKNPLNFVNNFSSLSADLVDELNETLAPAALDQKMRGEVSELTQMLKSNLEKVVQHGKRADSIVRNMLLHSREGSGERRSTDINTLVEESLNLAYHGARAEKPGFNITLARDLDSEAGEADLYPQEITRALLNFISNGFYAATRRRSEVGEENFEPVLSATTKSLGQSVEIRIRDNGSGIPLEVQQRMFNPFFTTKPAGEGTGLGLSMSHDIIVKQHSGRIDVETEPGAFTEFIITLPRNGAALISRGTG